ncbi:hypothetical protein ACUNWD_19705 [Sunxiuqinia sp. A32]|uniref:hypothetical protein n=1 Tax=Sunxiuqinia sp. A32 TaxID=3461496 RepID=UPI0040458AB0
MKTLFHLFLFATFFLITSCSKTVTETFDAEFSGEYVHVYTEDQVVDCPDEYNCRVIVDFNGAEKLLGDFSGTFNFCACGPEGEYGPTDSFIIAENGDSLFISCEGKVVEGREDSHPEFVTSYWKDPFTIIGGTGRFESATGSGTTDDYNSSQDTNSHHHWIGTITLLKAKQ